MARGTRRTKARRPEEIEIEQKIGQRIKERRMLMGLGQAALADGLGISFQQLLKYEKGHNRIAAGRLCACPRLLGETPESFFISLDSSKSGTPGEFRSDEALKLACAYHAIADPNAKDHVRKLVQAIAAGNS